MKNLFYIFAAIFTVFAMQSCERFQDLNGDLLSNADYQDEGLTGERFLYREYDEGVLIKEYHYHKRNLEKVIQPQDSSVVSVEYNGSRIAKVSYSQVYDNDSTAYERIYYYNEQALVNEIKETKAFKAADQDLIDYTKSNYNLTYTETNQLESITMRSGDFIPGEIFVFTNYTKATYEFDGENVIAQTKVYGLMDGNELGAINLRNSYMYENYDDKFAPYTLMDEQFILNQLIDHEPEAYRMSQNNTRKITFSSTQAPNPVTETSLFTYDPQNYGLLGFGNMFDYRPF